MKAGTFILIGALVGGVALAAGCGKANKDQVAGGKPLAGKEKKEKAEAIRKELERLKAEIAELQRQTEALEKDLAKSRAPEGK